MRLLPSRNVGWTQANRLARTVARRRARKAERRALAIQAVANISDKRKALRADYLAQVRKDREAGLEWGRVSRPKYRELCEPLGE